MKAITTWTFVSVLISVLAAGADEAAQKVDRVERSRRDQLAATAADWRAKDARGTLRRIIGEAQAPELRAAAELLLVRDLLGGGSREELVEARALAAAVAAVEQPAWHSDVGLFFKASVDGLLGDSTSQVKSAKMALSRIDFKRLQDGGGRYQPMIRASLGYQSDELRELLKMMLANACCQLGDAAAAAEAARAVGDPALRAAIESRVRLVREPDRTKRKRAD